MISALNLTILKFHEKKLGQLFCDGPLNKLLIYFYLSVINIKLALNKECIVENI